MPDNVATFESGARRSELAPRHDLIPQLAQKAYAQRMALGAESHGDKNWLQGQDDKKFQWECFNHMIEHARKFCLGDREDDHLAAIMCSAAFLREFQEMGKLLI